LCGERFKRNGAKGQHRGTEPRYPDSYRESGQRNTKNSKRKGAKAQKNQHRDTEPTEVDGEKLNATTLRRKKTNTEPRRNKEKYKKSVKICYICVICVL
jgi:hypothetical protein